MKHITVFLGTPRKGSTYNSCVAFIEKLQAKAPVTVEYVNLAACHLKPCIGCKSCFNKGEGFCPLQDDRNSLLEKLDCSDGVIFATPNYAYHVSSLLKLFIDRLAFLFHRPRYFGKVFAGIVSQGIFGGKAILKYLAAAGLNMGFETVSGCLVNALEPMTAKQQAKNEQEIAAAAGRFYDRLVSEKPAAPSLFRLMMFRMSRSSIKHILNDEYEDYRYFKAQGWFAAPYYCEVKLNPLRRLLGRLFDALGRGMAKSR